MAYRRNRGECKYGHCRQARAVKKYYQDGRLVAYKELGMCNRHRLQMAAYYRRRKHAHSR